LKPLNSLLLRASIIQAVKPKEHGESFCNLKLWSEKEVKSIIGEIIILNKKYSEKNLQLITGKKDIAAHLEGIPEEMLLLSEVIEDPLKLPYMLDTFYTAQIKNEKAFHFALLRVQVDSDLRMHEDIQKYQQRKYVAETLEKLLYGELMLSVGETLSMGED
jgi:hypothetical protein